MGIIDKAKNAAEDASGKATEVVGDVTNDDELAAEGKKDQGGTNLSQGVSVEVGEKQAAVDIDVVAEHGASIADLAGGLRRNVIAAIRRTTGLDVTEVDITVHDVHPLSDDGDDDTESVGRLK